MAGMYQSSNDLDHDIACAARLLRDVHMLNVSMHAVLTSWPVAVQHNLSNTSMNRQAWLGQAACCLAEDIPEDATRFAWRTLTETEQAEANAVADKVIAKWEREFQGAQAFLA